MFAENLVNPGIHWILRKFAKIISMEITHRYTLGFQFLMRKDEKNGIPQGKFEEYFYSKIALNYYKKVHNRCTNFSSKRIIYFW